MADSFLDRLRSHSPTSSQFIGFFALLTTGGISLFLGGLTVTGIVITLILLVPIFIFFSPILVPAGIALFLAVGGLLAAVAAGVVVLSIVTWLYKYFKGRQPVGSEQVERVRQRAIETAEHARHKARELSGQAKTRVQSVQNQGEGAAPGA